jgi:phosphoribosylglycinamide formyltransferase-1
MAVLLSGSGTTLQNLLDRISHGKLDARVVLVLSDRPGVFGLERAAKANIPHEVIDRKSFSSAQAFSETMFEAIRASGADLVVMAGFLRLLPIPADFTHKVMNIHPSLIPSFCGKGFHGHHVHQAVLDAGNKITGCTVHFADNVYDHGPIVIQRVVPVDAGDTPEAVQATGYILGAYDAMEGIVHCPSGMTPTAAQLVARVRTGLAQYKGPDRSADYLLAAVFGSMAPCTRKGLT